MSLDPGTLVGPYRITGMIGAGGMGEVYRAHDERLQRDVALKLMSERASGDPMHLRRMAQEARAAGQLSHPNILSVFDVGTLDDRMYVVTELLEGEPLREVIRRGPLPWRRALALAVPIAEGLAAAHDRGIVHRDIKPDNVFLTRDDRIKILDFGLATWRRNDPAGLGDANAATLSQAGLVVGTVGYMSPEQARGQSVDHRTDIFAFGCVLYEMVSGKDAFTGDTPMEVLVAIQRDAPVPLEDCAPGVPADVVRVVNRCLEKDPARRFQSTRDLLFALSLINTGAAADSGVSAKTAESARVPVVPPSEPVAPRTPDRRTALLVLASAALGGAATFAAARAFTRPPEPPVFRQITFRRGTVWTARFTVDGSSIVYSASWEGRVRELYVTVPGTPDARSLGQPETDVAHTLASGEIEAIRRSRRSGFSPGVLSRLSLAGGPPKPLHDGVTWADGSSDGGTVVIVRRDGARTLLEMPPGKAIAEAASISYPRLSPDGARIAYLEHAEAGDDGGRLIVVDRQGKRLLASEAWKSIEGVAWRTPSEIWFAASKDGRSLALYAITMKNELRPLWRVPGRLVLHDVSADGRAVAERNSYRATLMAGAKDAAQEQDLSWLDFTQLGDVSRDGKQVLFSEVGDGAGSGEIAYLRPLDGGVPLRLGEGLAMALSPDAKQAIVRVESPRAHLEVVPVGPGSALSLPTGPLVSFSWAAFVPGAPRVVLWGNEANRASRLYLQDLGGGDPRPLPFENLFMQHGAISPDGAWLAGMANGKPVLLPLDGGAIRPLPGLADTDRPTGWSSDGRALFVRKHGSLPLVIERYDLATGKLAPWRTLAPPDPAGVLSIGKVHIALDGDVWVYESYRLLSDLYIIENLR
jgi:hypothetical protein